MAERSEWYKKMAAATKRREQAQRMVNRWTVVLAEVEQEIQDLADDLLVGAQEQEQEQE